MYFVTVDIIVLCTEQKKIITAANNGYLAGGDNLLIHLYNI